MTTDDLYKPLVEDTTIQGKFTGIPMSPEPLVVFYNKKWFENANLPEPNEKWTWEQFFNDSVHLKDSNGVEGKEIYGSALPMNTTFLETLAQSAGGSLLSPDGSKTSGYLDSPAITQAVGNLMKDLNQSKVVKQVSSPRNPILQELEKEDVGMGISSAWNYSYLMNNKKFAGKFGVVSLPRSEKGLRANAMNISTLSIAAASTQQQLAWKFIKDVVLAPDSGFQPDWAKQEMLTSKAAIKKLKLNADPGMKVIYDELDFAMKPAIYINPKFQKVHTPNLISELNSAFSLEAVQKVLTETALDIDKQLSQLN
jgi:multiple sugar transport system substrate-binding protein